MTTSAVMILAMGVMFACGVYLMLERSLTRVLLGFLLMGNAINLLIMLTAGKPGGPPLTDGKTFDFEGMTDPLPQALVLTAIVITLAMASFLLALIYRSWRIARADIVTDDEEDVRVGTEGPLDDDDVESGTSGTYDDTEFGDEAESPIPGAPDLDGDGPGAKRRAWENAELDHYTNRGANREEQP